MTQTSRTLVPSRSLLEALSLCEVAARSVPVRGARRAKPTVSLSHLSRVEEEIGARLHDDVLCLLAIGDPVAKLMTGLASTVTIAEAAEDFEAPDGYVRIATVYADPIGELVDGAHGGPWIDLLAPRAPTGEAGMVLVATDGVLDEARELTLGAFVIEMLDRAVARGALPSYGSPKATPLTPPARLTGSAKPRAKGKRPLGTERVTHPKFGEGVVMARIGDRGDEKLVIAFPEGERTLLARFVTSVA